jgi:signal transduction histidine kinase
MRHLVRRSLLLQLLSVYLLFVVVVLAAGAGFNAVVEQQLRRGVQTSDQALAQEIALTTSLQLSDDMTSLANLGNLVAQDSLSEMQTNFQTYQAARNDVDNVYWLDPVGEMRMVWPKSSNIVLGDEFSPQEVVQQARTNDKAVFEVGIAAETTIYAGVIAAAPVIVQNHLVGIVAASLSLKELSEPLINVVGAQQQQNRTLDISIIDSRGELIATPHQDRFLQTVLDELPGAAQALQGHANFQEGVGPDGQDWLFSAVPVPGTGWAVVVQEPASKALQAVDEFHNWLFTSALLFAVGGLLFWLLLVGRVIRPLHILAIQHQALPVSEQAIPSQTRLVAARRDEMGGLARSLVRLERDGLEKLSELRTLLETSNAVVGSLDPYAVVGTIIREARRLVDVQAAAVLVPDEHGVLRVLVSDGHSEHFNDALSLAPENMHSTAVMALHDRQPVQRLIDDAWPSLAFDEGFRSVLAIPIISRHAGSVVLSVHRMEAKPFDANEIDLLLTFANYATLAWEHAVLYERSDERLREVAAENAQLYQQAAEEQQKLAAIMGSMSDGLVLTSPDGTILYANAGASVITGLPSAALERRPISALYAALRSAAGEDAAQHLAASETGTAPEVVVEIGRANQRRAIHVRLFDVGDATGQTIGRGLLLRDVTRERDLDAFKTALLAAVGHELRTPLAAIKGYASTLLQEDVSWPLADQRHFLATISGEADRMAQLVSNLLDLSRQETGLLLLDRAPSQVGDLVRQTLARLSYPDVMLDVAVPANLPLVSADATRIEVVLRNLIANAVTYGAHAVRISAAPQDGAVVVAIADDGPGIAPDELPYIFERFYRTRHGRAQHAGGTGLGLAICKAFIEAHGGAIWATSTGQGTTISFTLPLALPEIAAPSGPLANTGGKTA